MYYDLVNKNVIFTVCTVLFTGSCHSPQRGVDEKVKTKRIYSFLDLFLSLFTFFPFEYCSVFCDLDLTKIVIVFI